MNDELRAAPQQTNFHFILNCSLRMGNSIEMKLFERFAALCVLRSEEWTNNEAEWVNGAMIEKNCGMNEVGWFWVCWWIVGYGLQRSQCSAMKEANQTPNQQGEMEWKQLVEWMNKFICSWMKLMRQWNGAPTASRNYFSSLLLFFSLWKTSNQQWKQNWNAFI